ncbi:MAG: hypothetical protein BRD29_01545 [Bacteroidetes bacterium QH_2_67_10]|nr:MAG: hypothetical protein BRD29_01545 [Bacteroidetes bacterium QH_2_67_10]
MLINTLESKNRLVEEYGVDERQAKGIVELVAEAGGRPVSAALLEKELDAFEACLTRKMYGAAFITITVLGAMNYST